MTGVAAPVFTPFEVRWDAPQLSEADIARSGSAFEWWYFDLSTTDGVELVVILSRINPWFVTGKCSMSVEYKDATRKFHRVRNYDRAEFQWTPGAGIGELRIGPNVMRIVGDDPASMHYEITLDLPWISAALAFTPLHRGFLPGVDGTYFTERGHRDRRTCVSFSAPLMSVTGQLTVGGAARTVAGHGYHDHPWGTAQLFDTNREWHWARAATATTNVMFAAVTPFDEFDGTLTFLYRGDQGNFEPNITSSLRVEAAGWKRDALKGIRFPHEVTVVTPDRRWLAVWKETLLDMPFYNRCAVRWQPDDGGPAGTGWLEYWRLSPRLRRLTFWLAKFRAFFWRPFPYVGQ